MKEWNTSRTVISTRFKRQKGAIWLFAMRCTLVEWIMARWPFYPRDAYALARSLLSSCVWMSVCHMPVLCLNGWTCLKIFRPSGRPVILVFDPLRRYTIARGTPSTGVLNTRGGKNLRLSTEFAVYLGNGARYRLSVATIQYVSVPMTLSDLWSGYQGHDIFLK